MICTYCNNKLTKCDFLESVYENPLECSNCNYTLVNCRLTRFENEEPKDEDFQNFISFKVALNYSYYEILVDYLENSTSINKYLSGDGHSVGNVVKLTSALNITPSSAPDKLKTILTFL